MKIEINGSQTKTEDEKTEMILRLSKDQYDLLLDGLTALAEGTENELRQTQDPDIIELLIEVRKAHYLPVPQMSNPSSRENILKAAQICVCGDREQDYGSPEKNFETIANLWNIYLNARPSNAIAPHDVAAMLALLKVARIASGHAKKDNWVDLAGYAACGGEIEAKTEG